jgi:stage V sporulation protein G
MEISEVRVKLVENKDDRLKAFCSMTIDNCFVVRDIKIIDGAGGLFVAMPSRKMSDHCECGAKNYLRARFCSNCGKRLSEDRASKGSKGRLKLHADIAHPINAECRDMIQDTIIEAYNREVENSQKPGYVPTEMDTE